MPKADAKADRRRKRRALTEAELTRLLDVARRRPLLDAMTVRRGKRKGEASPSCGTKLRRRLGTARAGTGLDLQDVGADRTPQGRIGFDYRGQVVLDADLPYLILNAADEKNREGSTIPLAGRSCRRSSRMACRQGNGFAGSRVEALRPFDSTRNTRNGGKRNQGDSTGPEGQSCLPLTPSDAAADTPLFTVPAGLVRILDRDLVAAGIARRVEVSPGKWKIDKRDERGRTVDVHALRHTFGTLLEQGRV